MQLCSVEHKLNTSLTFFSSKLDSPVIKSLDMIRFSSNQNIGEEVSNFDEKMLKKCSTCVQLVFNLCSIEQSCIHIGNTCYKISSLISNTQKKVNTKFSQYLSWVLTYWLRNLLKVCNKTFSCNLWLLWQLKIAE